VLDEIKEKDSEQSVGAKKRNKELSNIVDQRNDTITSQILDLAALRALLNEELVHIQRIFTNKHWMTTSVIIIYLQSLRLLCPTEDT
jgi:hypothetical protein